MKRKLVSVLFAITITTGAAVAQDMFDALRFSQNFYEGTTRFSSMGGAFAALGGDFSTLSVNPAGLGVYRSSEFTFTPAISYSRTRSDYEDVRDLRDDRTRFGFSNVGYVSAINLGGTKGLVGVNFAAGYNKLNNFNYNVSVGGRDVGVFNSYVEGIVNQANAVGYDPAEIDNSNAFRNFSPLDWNAILAWRVGLIAFDNGSQEFFPFDSRLASATQRQAARLESTGSIGEYVFSVGANISHKLYIGGTLGIQDIMYDMTKVLQETPNEVIDLVSLTYRQRFSTSGFGINFKAGLIFRPIPELRLGAAIHTPTGQYLTDSYLASMSASTRSDGNIQSTTPVNDFDYRVRTPWKFIGGVAYTFKDMGMISVDYEYVDYSTMRLREDTNIFGNFGDSFAADNDMIRSTLRGVSNVRAGAEINVGSGFALRLGYAFYGTPYRSGAEGIPGIVSDSQGRLAVSTYSMGIGDNNVNIYSAGFGYRFNGGFIDLGYSNTQSKTTHILDDYEFGTLDGVTTRNSFNRFMMTVGLRF